MNSEKKKLVWSAVPTIFDVPNKPPQLTMKRKLPTRCDIGTPTPKKSKISGDLDFVDLIPEDRSTYQIVKPNVANSSENEIN